MPKAIHPVRKAKFKQAYLQGKPIAQCMTEAGYATTTAYHAQDTMTLVKLVKDEVKQEYDMTRLTPETVLKGLDEALERAIKKGDLTNELKVREMQGRFLAMFTDKKQVTTVEKASEQEQSILDKYIHSSRIAKE